MDSLLPKILEAYGQLTSNIDSWFEILPIIPATLNTEQESVEKTETSSLRDNNSFKFGKKKSAEIHREALFFENDADEKYHLTDESKHLYNDHNKMERRQISGPTLSTEELFSHISSTPNPDSHRSATVQGPTTTSTIDITFEANLHIKTLMEKSMHDTSSSATHAADAERILVHLEKYGKADTISYNGVINAYAKSRCQESAKKAEEILERMESIYRQQLQKIKLWSASSLPESTQNNETRHNLQLNVHNQPPPIITVKPNVRTYSTVIDAFSRRKPTRPHNGHGTEFALSSAKYAQALLDHLLSLYDATHDPCLKPNEISYNTVLNAWAKTGTIRGAQKATKMLKVMEDEGLADVISYNAVIHAWARCGIEEAAENAETILRRMEAQVTNAMEHNSKLSQQKHDRNFIRPNMRTYSSVIDAWSRSNHPSAAQRAQSILDEMETLYATTKDPSIQPNTISYSTVINAHARSRDMANKATSALKVLKKMQYLYKTGKNKEAKPTIITYNSVLNACATTYRSTYNSVYIEQQNIWEKNEIHHYQSVALGIAKQIYGELTSSTSKIRPDYYTYGTILKACANLMSPMDDDDATDFIRYIFEQCCLDGQVSFGVCFQLKKAAPIDLYRELIPKQAFNAENGHFRIQDMPKEWTRNVRERRRHNYR
eukprot:CAMPEP_0184868762 /NCGR_PEP_ID=MMETSP0580-20130426/31695_1 /TAXON_ID=1118495 /ORGANISM="Dactyliosolen fragilissimus" /LENGTH=661 /DNA_ID=CAMNT_0027369863 /DNA_START=315 /DNA_END=2301 /DNA_ORIENTATION=+